MDEICLSCGLSVGYRQSFKVAGCKDCTSYIDSAREAELNSGRQEKLPFAQLIIKPTIAGNAYPGKLSEAGKPKTASATMNQNWSASEQNGYYDTKYDVHVPAGGKIEVAPVL